LIRPGQKVWLVNISGGKITFSGTYTGSGSFSISILSLDQKTSTSVVSLSAAGDFNQSGYGICRDGIM
jgi:hypothetical protein